MPANVETMMYAGQVPWHGLGVPVETEVTSGEAIVAAGLAWRVEKVPVHAGQGGPEVRGYHAVVRTTDGKPLGLVGDRYVPIQNAEAFAFFDAVVGAGQAMYSTAGSLDGGRRVWLLARLPLEIRVGRWDVVEPFLLLSSSHDGTSSLRMLPTPVRVVCGNTLNLALARGVTQGIAIRHTASASMKVAEAQRVLGLAQLYYGNFQQQANWLAESRFTEAQMQQFTETLFPVAAEKPSSRMLKAREEVVRLFECGMGQDMARGSGWAAWNAVAEYADHVRSVRSGQGMSPGERRLSSIWFGSAASLKQKAHEAILRQLAA